MKFGTHFVGAFVAHGHPEEALSASEPWKDFDGETFVADAFSLKLRLGNKKWNGSDHSEHDNQKVHVFVLGEFYNVDELCTKTGISRERQGTENYAGIAASLYSKYGTDFPKFINGMFCILIYDREKRSVLLYADRFASAFPVYYYFDKDLYFGSQLKLMARCIGPRREISNEGLAIFLKYSYIPTPMTMIKGVRKIGPGEVLMCEGGGLRVTRYASFAVERRDGISEGDAIAGYRSLLEKSIHGKIQDVPAERVGFFLSGGLDSSANVALAARSGCHGFKTFGIGFDNPKLDERPFARIVAEHFGVQFQDYVFRGDEIEDLPSIVWHIDEPFMENGLFLTYAGFRAVGNDADLIIAGDGADQLFGTGGFAGARPIALRFLFDRLHVTGLIRGLRKFGSLSSFYDDTFWFKLKVLIDRATDFNHWFFWGFDDQELSRLLDVHWDKTALASFSNDLRGAGGTFEGYYLFAQLFQDIEHFVCQNVMVKSSRMAERFGVSLREAYLDKEVMDFLLSLPINLKTKGKFADFLRGKRVTKYLHRRAMADILPPKILAKPKQGGFVPLVLLLSDVKRKKLIFEYIRTSSFLRDRMDMKQLEKILQDGEIAITREGGWPAYLDCKINQIMNLLVASLWHGIIFADQNNKIPTQSLSQFLERNNL